MKFIGNAARQAFLLKWLTEGIVFLEMKCANKGAGRYESFELWLKSSAN